MRVGVCVYSFIFVFNLMMAFTFRPKQSPEKKNNKFLF